MLSAKKSISLTAIVLLLLVTIATSYECPTNCSCIIVNANSQIYDHAKCLSLDGLKTIERSIPIQSLDLSAIGIDRIPSQLDKLRELKKIDLSHNRLSEVSRLNKRIRELNLSHNRITSGKLAKIPQFVQKLDLSYNDITYLPAELMNLKNLMQIELAGNAINCSCETLQIRNWLQEKHVWSDEIIKCGTPLTFKGQSWLRVKQTDVCPPDDSIDQEKNIWDDDNDNELMMGDAPALSSSGDGSPDELENDFMPYNANKDAVDKSIDDDNGGSGDDELFARDSTSGLDDYEGSGGLLVRTHSENLFQPDYDEDNDGSGSGNGTFIIMATGTKVDDFKTDDLKSEEEKEEETTPIPMPIEDTTKYTPATLNIFRQVARVDDVTKAPAVEEEIQKEAVNEVAAAPPTQEVEVELVEPSKSSEEMKTGENGQISHSNVEIIGATVSDNEENNKNTYILLAILGILLVALIAFVAVKRTRRNRRNRRADVESPRGTELMDMDKQLLGKPLHKNGGNPESVPLMKNKDKSDFAKPINGDKTDPTRYYNPYQPATSPAENEEEPKQRSENQSVEEATPSPMKSFKPEPKARGSFYENAPENTDSPNNYNNNNVDEAPTTNGEVPATAPVPLPRSEQPAGVHKGQREPPSEPAADENEQQSESSPLPPNKDPDEVFIPKSPALARYSPVYSPETGRVKIKLTETPKPKTPLLVTRSRSNAGDIITTPSYSPKSQN